MRLKKSAILLIATLLTFAGQAQDYFVTKENDTIFCNDLSYSTTAQGYLSKIVYENAEGKVITIKGRKNVPDVVTFYRDSTTIDRTPLRAHKPDSYVRFTRRAVDGKLKVYSSAQGKSTVVKYRPDNISEPFKSGGATGIYRLILKMPDGTYYDGRSKKNMKKYIKPFLLMCEAFKNEYKGDFSTGEHSFMEMIAMYNYLCEQ